MCDKRHVTETIKTRQFQFRLAVTYTKLRPYFEYIDTS